MNVLLQQSEGDSPFFCYFDLIDFANFYVVASRKYLIKPLAAPLYSLRNALLVHSAKRTVNGAIPAFFSRFLVHQNLQKYSALVEDQRCQ